MPLTRKAMLARDILSAWGAIDNGVVDKNNKEREKYWSHWEQYCQAWNKHPHLLDCSPLETIIILTAFAARVRTGHYGRGKRVTVQTVKVALSAISKTIELGGQPSPIYKAEDTYKVPVARLIEGMRREDPPSVPQLAVPIAVPEHVLKKAYQTDDNILHAIGDLSLIAFYYLLRVGEYTKPKWVTINGVCKRATRTTQFSVGNIGFFKKGNILSRNSPLERLLKADSCTLKITQQKNGTMGQTIHHHTTGKHNSDPVQAMARRIHHILSNGGNTDNLICDVFEPDLKGWYQVNPSDMLISIRAAITDLKLDQAGITPDLVGVHSYRAGGAMALKLTGSSDTTIMKLGRWKSLAFLEYLHNQIAHLSSDLSNQMSTQLEFNNIAAIE